MAVTVIQQGDQYFLPLTIKRNGTPVTDQSGIDVKIKIGNVTKKSDAGELAYGEYTKGAETLNAWLFLLTQEMSLSWKAGSVPIQVQLKENNNIISSATKTITIGFSAIEETW